MAFTEPKDWAVSEQANAALLNVYQRDNVRAIPHRLIQKLVDETLANSTTLQNDNEMFVAVGASETWYFRVFIEMKNSVAVVPPHFKVAFTVPASTVMSMSTAYWNSSGSGAFITWTTSGTGAGLYQASANSLVTYDIEGIIVTAGTVGQFQVQWAQQNLDTGNVVTVTNRSSIWGMKLA